MFHRCSKMFLIVLNRLPRLLDLRQRTDPVIVFRNVRIVNGAIVLCHFQGAVSHKAPKAPSLSSGEIQKGARRPPLVVSIGEVRRRGRFRFLPLLRVVFFASFLLDKQKKGRVVPSHFSWISAHAFPSAEHSAAKERRPMVGATLAELPGSIRLLFFSLAGDREKKASCSPVFVLAHAIPTGLAVFLWSCRADSNCHSA